MENLPNYSENQYFPIFGVNLFMKMLWAEFLYDFQNVETQIFRKTSNFQEKIYKNFTWGLRDLKITKNSTFWWKNIKILSYRSFWVPLVISPIILNILFFENYLLFWSFGYQHFEIWVKTQPKSAKLRKKIPIFPFVAKK